jgi:hypothetical protein
VRLDEDRVVQGRLRERGGGVAGALGGDAQAALAGEVDDGDDVGHGLGLGDGGRTLVDGEVPGLPRLVPTGVAGTVTAPISCSRSAPASIPAEVVLYILKAPKRS